VIELDMQTDIERLRILGGPIHQVTLLKDGSLSVDNISIEKVELRQYLERSDKVNGYYSLITAYLKSSKGEIELKFNEGFLGRDPLPEISLILMRYVGLESLINRLLIALNET
jgi:hypothetical protein